jgi:hypothetical protein
MKGRESSLRLDEVWSEERSSPLSAGRVCSDSTTQAGELILRDVQLQRGAARRRHFTDTPGSRKRHPQLVDLTARYELRQS